MRQLDELDSRKCPPGYTYRKGYTRKMRKKAYTVQRKGQLYNVSIKKTSHSVARRSRTAARVRLHGAKLVAPIA